MKYQMHEQSRNGNKTISMLTGMLVGGMAGAATMLLLAPQSGKRTRDQIQKKSIELRDQATETVEDVVTQVKQTAEKVSGDVREKVNEIRLHGKDIIEDQQEKLAAVVEGDHKDKKVHA